MTHIAALPQLQIPPWAPVDSELVRDEDVRIRISAGALTRALSVFNGVKRHGNTATPATAAEVV